MSFWKSKLPLLVRVEYNREEMEILVLLSKSESGRGIVTNVCKGCKSTVCVCLYICKCIRDMKNLHKWGYEITRFIQVWIPMQLHFIRNSLKNGSPLKKMAHSRLARKRWGGRTEDEILFNFSPLAVPVFRHRKGAEIQTAVGSVNASSVLSLCIKGAVFLLAHSTRQNPQARSKCMLAAELELCFLRD